MRKTVSGLVAMSVLLGLAACASRSRDRELERVAKDWSMVIRASQVIPVYPLTEDLQPGDTFLVQVPVEEQAEIYRERGFLPLDNLIHRLNPTGYDQFYAKSYGVGGPAAELPKTWLSPGQNTAWDIAPKAAFPTYSFSARSGVGLSVALPVQGVPVGLGLLGGEAARGSITIADARTYGVDTVSLYRDIVAWAARNRAFVRSFAPHDGKQNYLRVVSRIYLTGRLNTTLQTSQEVSGSVSLGAPKPVDLVVPDPKDSPDTATVEAYTNNIAKLNSLIESALKAGEAGGLLPGGTVKLVSASSGSVSLSETFPRALVVGYLGFDVPILADGVLGPPIPTHAVLQTGRGAAGGAIELGQQLTSTAMLGAAYGVLAKRQGQDPEAKSLVTQLDALAESLPTEYPTSIFGLADQNGPLVPETGKARGSELRRAGFRSVVTYRGDLVTSLENLRLAQRQDTVAIEGFATRDAAAEAFLRTELAAGERALADLTDTLRPHAILFRQAAEHAASIEE